MCRLRRDLLRSIFVVLFLLPNAAVCAGADTLTIATFNCEFLTRPEAHVKFGLDFNLEGEPASVRQEWSQPGHRDQNFNEASRAAVGAYRTDDPDVIHPRTIHGLSWAAALQHLS